MQTRFLTPLLILPVALLADPQGGAEPWPTDPVATIKLLETRLEQADATVLWDQLPASYQRDVEGLVDLFADEMDPQVWTAIVGLVGSVGELLEEQRGLIIEMVESEQDMGELTPEETGAAMDAVARMLKGFATGPFGTLEKMKAADLRSMLGDSTGWLLEQAIESGDTFGDTGMKLDPTQPIIVELAQREGDRATVHVGTTRDELEPLELRLVESKWVLADLADDWETEMASAREGMTGMFGPDSAVSTSALVQLIGTAQGVIDDLTVAETIEEFEQSAQMGMFTLMGAAMGSGLGEALMDEGSR